MATYSELFTLSNDASLRNKVTVALVIKAQALLDTAPTAAEVTWSKEALENPKSKADDLLFYVLAANKGLSVSAIEGATDSAIQTNVDAAVGVIISGGT